MIKTCTKVPYISSENLQFVVFHINIFEYEKTITSNISKSDYIDIKQIETSHSDRKVS